uniref:PAS domain S-box protein n=1 Tax=candidate division WOR-3 bacterium TaxID=2052148 RepID=A0A7C6AGJ7_UNCW3
MGNTGNDYKKIIDALVRAGSGDLTTEITLSTDDQNLNAIAREFNKMVNKLKATITELRESNRQMEAIVKRLERIFNNSGDIILFINKYGTIVEINKSVKDILGYEPDDLKGKHFAKTGLIFSEEIPDLLERFKIAVKKAVIKDKLNLTCITKDGVNLHMEAGLRLLKDEEEVEGIIVVLRNVTEHIQSDIRLKEEKEKLRSIISSIEDLVLIVNKDLHLVEYYESPSSRENFILASVKGYAGKSIKNFFPKSIASEIEKTMQYCMKTREIQQIDYPVSAQKKNLWFSARIAPVEDSNKSITGVSILIRDITEQVDMEKALEQAEEKYRKIFEQSPQGLIILDAEGRIVDVNKKLCELLGYKRSEMVGKDHLMYPFLTKSGKIMAMRKFIQRLSGKFVQPYEIEFIAKDGTVYLCEIDARPIKDEKGNILLLVVMVTDVTKRR